MSGPRDTGTRDGAVQGRGGPGPVFLERSGYRRRRLVDAIRMVPVLGVLLWAVPLLWTKGATASSAALLYTFGVWALLVLAAALLSRGLRGSDWAGSQEDEGGEAR